MTYATLDELRSALRIPDTDDDAGLSAALAAASALVDAHCGRTFSRTDEPVARYFAPTDPRLLRLPDVADAAGLLVESDEFGADGDFDVTWDASEYQLEVLSEFEHGRPATRIRAVSTTHTFPLPVVAGRYTVRVTAVWGWPEVPAQVQQATLLQAARIFKRSDAPFGIAGTPDIGQMRLLARLDPDVAVLLEGLRNPRLSAPGSVGIG